MIDFIKNHFTKGHIIAAVLLVATITGIISVNAYILDMTRGSYNIIDILFM